jgi:hypothetical protein
VKGRILALGRGEVDICIVLDQVQGNLVIAQYCGTLERSHAILERVHKVLFLKTVEIVFIFLFLIFNFNEFSTRQICFG